MRLTSLVFGFLSLFFICAVSAVNKSEFYKIIKVLFLSLIEGIKLVINLKYIYRKSKLLQISKQKNIDQKRNIKIEPTFSIQNQFSNKDGIQPSIQEINQEKDLNYDDTMQQSFNDDLLLEKKRYKCKFSF